MFWMKIGHCAKWDQLRSEVDSSAKLWELRQVMQSEKFAPVRQLKLHRWIVLVSHIGAYSDGKIVN